MVQGGFSLYSKIRRHQGAVVTSRNIAEGVRSGRQTRAWQGAMSGRFCLGRDGVNSLDWGCRFNSQQTQLTAATARCLPVASRL